MLWTLFDEILKSNLRVIVKTLDEENLNAGREMHK